MNAPTPTQPSLPPTDTSAPHMAVADALTNPAARRLTAIPPAVLEAAAKDPEVAQSNARVMAVVVLDSCFKAVADPKTRVETKLEFLKELNKMGGLYAKADSGGEAAGPAFTVNINFSNKVAQLAKPATQAKPVPADVVDVEPTTALAAKESAE